MKIAVLFPGHPRTYKQTFENFKENILNVYKEYTLDIFIWAWDELGYWTPSNEDGSVPQYGVYGNSGKANIPEIINLYKPKKYRFEKLEEHTENIMSYQKKIIKKKYPFVRPFNNVSCWYTIHQCDMLRREYEKENNMEYDIVLRFRFDLEITRPIILTGRFTFSTDIWGVPVPHGYDDTLFFGTGKTMETICDLILNIEEIANSIIDWDSHSAFKYWVDKNYPNFEYRGFSTKLINTPGGCCQGNSLPQ